VIIGANAASKRPPSQRTPMPNRTADSRSGIRRRLTAQVAAARQFLPPHQQVVPLAAS
jgi:hypothetical protein